MADAAERTLLLLPSSCISTGSLLARRHKSLQVNLLLLLLLLLLLA
jgi:hypothetical protein